MIKTLTPHGDDAALVIERPILDLLGATVDTPFEVVTDGKALILTPAPEPPRAARFREAMENIGDRYAQTFEELAK